MMKSSALFECGPLPPYVHLASTKRHSRDRCSQAFPVFCTLPLPCITKTEKQNGGGLGTRLCLHSIRSSPSIHYLCMFTSSHLCSIPSHIQTVAPGPPQNLRVVNVFHNYLGLRWEAPTRPNGIITEYNVSHIRDLV